MIPFELVLSWSAAALYLLASILAWIHCLWQVKRPFHWSRGLLSLGLLVHAIAIIERWLRVDHGPYIGAFEVLPASVWVGFLALLVLSFRHDVLQATFAPVLSIGVLFMGWGISSDPETIPLPVTFRGIWMVFHIVSAKLAFGSILLATGLSLTYLFKSGKKSYISVENTHSLIRLDRLSYSLVAFGFVFIGLMTVSGAIWAQNTWGFYWRWDPLETWSLITWLAYGLGLHLRRTFNFRDRRWALAVLVLFGLTVFTFFVAILIIPTIHIEFLKGT